MEKPFCGCKWQQQTCISYLSRKKIEDKKYMFLHKCLKQNLYSTNAEQSLGRHQLPLASKRYVQVPTFDKHSY